MQFLNDLNPEQQEAVCHIEGPVLVLAGAGSGKTRVLTYRIAYLIGAQKIDPFNILAITFTNKAAQEMKKRVLNLLVDFRSPWVSTFHAFCARVLRKEIEILGYSKDFTIYTDTEQQTLIKDALKYFNLDEKQYTPRGIASQIGAAKNQLISPESYARNANSPVEKKIAEIYTWYEKRLQELNGLDFDDLIMKTVQLWQKHPDILDYYQNRFRYILIDEYQDTNHSQYILVKMLASKYRNICVVGDPDQSIYGWRGADLGNILSFERDYPDARVIKLEMNYRSTRTILEAANHVVSYNHSRKEKNLRTNNEEGQPIIEFVGADEQDEARFVLEQILFLKRKENRKNSDFAIFYRVNAQSRVLEDVLMRYQIPYRIIGGRRFYDRKEIRDIIAYLRVIANPSDNISLSRIINVPRRGVGDITWRKIVDLAAEQDLSYYEAVLVMSQELKEQGKTTHPLVLFVNLIEDLRKKSLKQEVTWLTEEVLERSGYIKMLREENTLEARSRIENLQEFLSVTRDFDDHGFDDDDLDLNSENKKGLGDKTPYGNEKLLQFLAGITLATDLDSYQEEENTVVLMTLHGAKGLEFPVVFLTGMEEEVFPLSRCKMNPEELEEERRLCYVGITRAKEKLYLTRAARRNLFGYRRSNPASRFIKEIPPEFLASQDSIKDDNRRPQNKHKENLSTSSSRDHSDIADLLMEYTVGDRVKHAKFGEGVVVQVKQDNEIAVAFPGRGIKQLLLDYAPIRKLV